MMSRITSSTPSIFVVVSAAALLVLNAATTTALAQDIKLCRCTAKFERFYDRRSLMQKQRQEEGDRSLKFRIYPYDYKDYYVDVDGYYIVEGLRVLPDNDPACDNGSVQLFNTFQGKGGMKGYGKGMGKRKGKGKRKGNRCKVTDTSPECLPTIFPCPTNPAPVQPPEMLTDLPTGAPLMQIAPCRDGSAGPIDENTCVDVCPDDDSLEKPFGCVDACPDGAPVTGSCVRFCESGSNSIPSGCREACCPKEYCPFDGSIAPSDPGSCAVLCPNDGSFFDGCRPKCPTDGSSRPNSCVDVCTGALEDSTTCEEACCFVEQPSAAPTNSPTKAPTNSPKNAPTNSSTKSPTKAPSKAPTMSPTAIPTMTPFITPPNSTCVSDQGTYICFCDPGFVGDPEKGCIGLPVIFLTGVTPTTFNALNSSICFIIVNDEFKTDDTSLKVALSNIVVPLSQLTVAADQVCLVDPSLSQSSAVDFSIMAIAAGSGAAISRNETFWVGSESATIFVVYPNGTEALQEVTVTARLADDASVMAQQTGSSATFVFNNLPLRTIIYDAVAEDGSAGASALSGSGSTTIELLSFAQPIEIDNNDFSLGTIEGWMLSDESAGSIVLHLEDGGPNVTGSGRRLEDLSNRDFRLMTRDVGSQTVSRTFETKKTTTGVRIRYRFETSEFPTYYLTQYNDFFKVSIRSKKAGGYRSEANSMNGLGSNAFGKGSVYASTNWRELVLPVSGDGDTIQIDVTVANVADGIVDSDVYIDFVDELTQGLCIYSKSNPNDDLGTGHAALAFYNKTFSQNENQITITTYGLWPDSVVDNGDATDIRVNFDGDIEFQKYKYFYCEGITDKEKKVLDGIVTQNVNWTCTNSCASFASETFYAVTGTDVDNDDVLGLDTPREISRSIYQLNGGREIPKEGLPWQSEQSVRRLQDSIETSYPGNFVSLCILPLFN